MPAILIQAWVVHKSENRYFLPYTHWVYLKEIVKYYDKVTLLSPVKQDKDAERSGMLALDEFSNVNIHELPYSNTYVSAVKNISHYRKAYKALKGYDTIYARYPAPFGWMGKMYHRNKKRIVHFVGDPIDAARSNPNFSFLRKATLISFFMPEHLAYLWACKGARIFTNGHHLKDKLSKWKLDATAVVSSTLSEKDFFFDENKVVNENALKFLYVGYLRKAKGVETVIRAFKEVKEKHPGAVFNIVGSGEFEKELRELASQLGIDGSINFLGHIDDRDKLNSLLRENDFFLFGSLSEGSPRVVLEAMANGINVISTPVGSLPTVFEDKKELLFAGFNDVADFHKKIESLVTDSTLRNALRKNAYNKVRDFTIEQFIRKIFS